MSQLRETGTVIGLTAPGRPGGAVDDGEAPPVAGPGPATSRERTRPVGGAWLGLAAFAIYALVAAFLWGRHVLPHLGSVYHTGTNVNDQRFYQWALAWWPYAIGHGLDPVQTTYLWAPGGVNLTWVTSLAGPSIIMAPLTLLAGPLVTENLLFLLAPALAAWAAYLVCRRITGRFLPSLAGGYLFGFSSYIAGQMQGHLNLVLVFPVPLALYLVLRRTQGDLKRWTFVTLLGATLLLQFSISTEVFATMVLFGACCLAGAAALGGRGARSVLRPLWIELGAAFAIALLLALPYLVIALRNQPSPVPWEAYRTYLGRYSTDLAGPVVPRAFTMPGGHMALSTSARFEATAAEDGSYFGIPLLIGIVAAVAVRRRQRLTWLLFAALVLSFVLSLGPVLHVFGTGSVPLPWTVIAHLPAIGIALPARMILYAWLAAAILVARWLAPATVPAEEPTVESSPGATAAVDDGKGRRWTRPAGKILAWAIAALAAVSLVPAVAAPAPVTTLDFFTDGTYRQYIHRGDTILTLPFYTPNAMMAWQVQTGFDFRLAGGYVGWRGIPLADRADRATHGLVRNEPGRTPPWALRSFLLEHHVTLVIISRYARIPWERTLWALNLRVIRAGPLLLYRIPPDL